MRIYIASKYIAHKILNQHIYDYLKSQDIDAFLPATIEIDAITQKEMQSVSEICYNEIERCNVFLLVCPFGKSVASEIGYAVALKRWKKNIKIVALNFDSNYEAMISPYLDKNVTDVFELVSYLNSL